MRSFYKWALLTLLVLTLCACTAQTNASSGSAIGDDTPLETVAPLETVKPASAQSATSSELPGTTGPLSPAQSEQPAAPGEPVSANWFDDAVFVGDSVSLKLNYYNMKEFPLGKAQFLTSGSLGSANALWEISDKSVHPSYQGQKMKVEDAVAKTGAKKLFIMLGMNDVGLYGPEDSVDNFCTLMDKILEQSPDLTVYVQSVTPKTSTSTLKALTNEKIVTYNTLMAKTCEDRGWHFVNVAEIMTGSDGCLPREYCSDPDDMGIHFTEAACAMWVEYLKAHAVN